MASVVARAGDRHTEPEMETKRETDTLAQRVPDRDTEP
jgi:hypothetical protein